MSGWYVKRNDQKYGPYSSTQLVEMAKKGQVLSLDWVSRGEDGQWMPASQVKGLFAAPPPLPTDAHYPHLPASNTTKMQDAIPTSIFRPVIGMTAVISASLLVSFICGSLPLFFLSFIHNAGAVACIILTARLQKFLYAPLAALLTMTVWGWYCFTPVPMIVAVLGVLVGISVGTWALFAFFTPKTRRQFADPSFSSRLERFPVPALAGILGGGLLALILGTDLVLWLIVRPADEQIAGNNPTEYMGKDKEEIFLYACEGSHADENIFPFFAREGKQQGLIARVSLPAGDTIPLTDDILKSRYYRFVDEVRTAMEKRIPSSHVLKVHDGVVNQGNVNWQYIARGKNNPYRPGLVEIVLYAKKPLGDQWDK